MSGKRAFPFHSEVKGFELQRRKLDEDPSRDRDAPKLWQAREQTEYDDYDTVTGDVYAAAAAAVGTDFSQWTEAEVRAFLEQRGEDYDDCPDLQALVKRAAECEANTGPAKRPELPTAGGGQAGEGEAGGDDENEIDPLDAFMAEIAQVEAEAPAAAGKPSAKGHRVEEEDHVEGFVQARRRGQLNAMFVAAAAARGDDEDVYKTAAAVDAATGAGGGGADYDSDEAEQAAVGAAGKKDVESLAALNHEGLQYTEFNKDFYEEAAEVAAMSSGEVAEYRRQLGMRVSGFDAPRPVKSFSQCGFDAPLAATIAKAGYEKPTAIQAQALPAALCGRDVLGIAKTGSGKTAAFVLPMIVHIMDQPELKRGEGPIAVIVAPTRELAEQIHRETRRFSKAYGLRVCAAFGGLSKQQQFKDLKAGSEVAVCTPGRMIDLIKMKACTMTRVTYLVFDEADRMFDMGFEPQVRSIMGQIRPDRQTLLFSATMPRKVEGLSADALTSPVRITVGEVGGANEDIKQVVEVLLDIGQKQKWLLDRLQRFVDEGDVLIFANQKARVDELCAALQAAGARVASIHGDMDQHTRMTTLHDFKAGQYHALVATDVAARGLDIKSIKIVVNYDAAKDIDTHVHRIGRTGRAGDKDGVAYTLLLQHESRIASDLVQNLANAGQEVPAALHELAARDPRFRKGTARGKGGRGGRGGIGGRGRGQMGGAGLGFGGGGGGRRGSSAPPPHVVPGAATAAGAAKAAAAAAALEAAPVVPAPGGMSGFARSHGGDDSHFATGGRAVEDASAAAAARAAFVAEAEAISGQKQKQQVAPTLPPPPRGFAAAATRPPAGYQHPPQQQQQPAAQTSHQQQQQYQPPLPQDEPASAQEGRAPPPNSVAAARAEQQAAWTSAKRQSYTQSFQTGFVSSGTRQGDVGAKAEIVLPKNFRPQASVPPPPVPVTQQPMYLQQRQQPSYGSRGGIGGGSFHAATPMQQTQPTPAQTASVQQAIEQARAVAARLAAQGAGGAGGGAYQPPAATAAPPLPSEPQPSAVQSAAVQQAMEQARAIAARLAAQAPGSGAQHAQQQGQQGQSQEQWHWGKS